MTLTEIMTTFIKSKRVCTCLSRRLHLADPMVDISAEDKSTFLPRLYGPRGHQELIERSEQLREGTAKVRATLGTGVPVTDREIEESLWHYYYDVEKTVNYLLSTATRFLQAFVHAYAIKTSKPKLRRNPQISRRRHLTRNWPMVGLVSSPIPSAMPDPYVMNPFFNTEEHRYFLVGMLEPSIPLRPAVDTYVLFRV